VSPTLRRFAPLAAAAAALAIVLLVMGIVRLADPPGEGVGGAGSGGSSGSTGSGSAGSSGAAMPSDAPSTEPGPDQPMTRFTTVRATDDGRALAVTFWGGVDTCYRYDISAAESSRDVSLSLSEERRTDGPCIDLAQEYDRTVALDEPLAGRRVVDAATGEVVLDRR